MSEQGSAMCISCGASKPSHLLVDRKCLTCCYKEHLHGIKSISQSSHQSSQRESFGHSAGSKDMHQDEFEQCGDWQEPGYSFRPDSLAASRQASQQNLLTVPKWSQPQHYPKRPEKSRALETCRKEGQDMPHRAIDRRRDNYPEDEDRYQEPYMPHPKFDRPHYRPQPQRERWGQHDRKHRQQPKEREQRREQQAADDRSTVQRIIASKSKTPQRPAHRPRNLKDQSPDRYNQERMTTASVKSPQRLSVRPENYTAGRSKASPEPDYYRKLNDCTNREDKGVSVSRGENPYLKKAVSPGAKTENDDEQKFHFSEKFRLRQEQRKEHRKGLGVSPSHSPYATTKRTDYQSPQKQVDPKVLKKELSELRNKISTRVHKRFIS